jgi:hypothetical protein
MLSSAVALWAVGFAWGSIVFTVPQLMDLPSLPHVSKYPAISGVLLVLYIALAIFIVRREVRDGNTRLCLKLGLILSASNFLLDLMVYFLILNARDYFEYFSVWVSYALLLFLPALTKKKGSN